MNLPGNPVELVSWLELLLLIALWDECLCLLRFFDVYDDPLIVEWRRGIFCGTLRSSYDP